MNRNDGYGSARRGRPRAGERAARREEVLDAAFDLLVEHGYRGTTMGAVAERSGASKETLYAWFGDKTGLFAALVQRNAEEGARTVQAALASERGDVAQTLSRFGTALLALLLGERALAINRAAIIEPAAAPELSSQVRERIAPMVEAYLAYQTTLGRLRIRDPVDAFGALYGLLVQDAQISALLGGTPLDRAGIDHRARTAVDRFLALAEKGAAG